MKKTFARSICTLLFAVAASGCALIDRNNRVEDWPPLKIVEHDLPYAELYKACQPYIGPWDAPLACTVFYLDAGEAHIYVAKGLKFGPIVEHERMHALGYDHYGSTHMKEVLAHWKAQKAAQAAEAEATNAAALALRLP